MRTQAWHDFANEPEQPVFIRRAGMQRADEQHPAASVQAGSLASAFMIVYMLAAPPIAWLADSRGRKPWIAAGVGIWSLATGAAGLATGFRSLFFSRAAVGIGEACYGAISPAFVLRSECVP